MILVATGADASANNLGKISLKTVADINPAVTNLLSFFNKTWSDDKKIAIDDFYMAYQAASWKDKVKLMIIPILMPAENAIVNARWKLAGGVFTKNIANLNTPAIPLDSAFIAPTYGYLGLTQNGVVFQNGTNGDITSNLGASYNTTAFGVTNKSAHYGCYFIAQTKVNAGIGGGNPASGQLSVTGGSASAYFYNNISIPQPTTTTMPFKGLCLVNGSVTLNTGKSYIKNALVASNIIGTQASTVLSLASLLHYGTDNVANESTNCFMTFGEYLTDSELTAYAAMINTLMDALLTA